MMPENKRASLKRCKACNGWGNIQFVGQGRKHAEFLCVRCLGSGNEPAGFWAQLEAFFSRQHIPKGYSVLPYLTPKPRPEDIDGNKS